MYKAVVFDIGRTLVDYRKPMNWSKMYRPAFEQIAEKMQVHMQFLTIEMEKSKIMVRIRRYTI